MRLAGVVLFCFQLWAQDARYAPQGDQIPGPPTPAEFSTWLNDIRHWRAERLIRAGYSSKEYERPELAWSRVYDDQHWTSDVTTSAIIGMSAVATTMDWLDRRWPRR